MTTHAAPLRRVTDLLQRAWHGRGFLACLLWPASQLYGLAVGVRRNLYSTGFLQTARVGVPVIVVGNVVAGGAGKTPLVMALVHHLQDRGFRVGVVSRGYGRRDRSCREVFADTPVYQSGDEPALIKRATHAPVFVASGRVEAARALLKAHPATEIVVSDDGLQHYALARDIEIAVFDDRGAGNGWLIPAGPLREPWPERLRSGIDLVLHSGHSPAFAGFTSSRQLADYALAADGSQVLLAGLQGLPLIALAAIANPAAFFAMLESRGLRLDKAVSLPDHCDFSDYRLDAEAGATVLCTEKDAVKLFGLPSMAAFRLLAVPLHFLPETAFLSALDALIEPLLSQLPLRHGH